VEFNNLKAVAFVVIAMSMITTNDAIVKHPTQVFNVGQIMFLRGAVDAQNTIASLNHQ